MRSERVWPFGESVKPQEWFALDRSAVQPALDVVLAAIDRMQSGNRGG